MMFAYSRIARILLRGRRRDAEGIEMVDVGRGVPSQEKNSRQILRFDESSISSYDVDRSFVHIGVNLGMRENFSKSDGDIQPCSSYGYAPVRTAICSMYS